jgi:hypothetical protein
MFHQLCRAIEPPLPLREVVDDWSGIARALTEGPRQRKTQLNAMFQAGHLS